MTTRAIGYDPNPSDGDLKAVALGYLKSCQPEEYAECLRDGDLEEYVGIFVRNCRKYAESMSWASMDDLDKGQVWNRAVREVILRSETD
jgi:hypothetical protein